eukprot:8519659-Alexandrium_andersonii.AAC.1
MGPSDDFWDRLRYEFVRISVPGSAGGPAPGRNTATLVTRPWEGGLGMATNELCRELVSRTPRH